MMLNVLRNLKYGFLKRGLTVYDFYFTKNQNIFPSIFLLGLQLPLGKHSLHCCINFSKNFQILQNIVDICLNDFPIKYFRIYNLILN